jgi:hypothetical protein
MVRCSGCGFAYGLGDKQGGYPEALEITMYDRHGNQLGKNWKGRTAVYCLLKQPHIDTHEFQGEHDCAEFREYTPGFSPQEHWRMRHDEWMLERADRLELEQRVFLQSERRFNKWMRIVEAFLVLLTIGAIIGAAWLGWLLSTSGDEPKPSTAEQTEQ